MVGRIGNLISTGAGPLQSNNAPRISEKQVQTNNQNRKTIGEAPPVRLSLNQIGQLASLFAPRGMVGRLEKKLNYLLKKKCKVVPAKGTVACIDEDDIVYLGIDFLSQYQDDEETIAGVLCHEWGHSCAERPTPEELEDLNWDEIFELRRAHETLADEKSGRLLSRLGYTPRGIINFLMKGKETHNHKYHPKKTRAKIVALGFQKEEKNKSFIRKIFNRPGYKNEYDSILLDIS